MDSVNVIWSPWFMFGAAILCVTLLGVLTHGYLRSKAPVDPRQTEERLYVYRWPVRIWHWLNALLFVYLGITGFLGHFGVIPHEYMKKFHGAATQPFMLLWVYMIILNIVSGNGKYYRLKFKGLLSRCLLQGKYYLSGILKGEEAPFPASENSKFNPLQQLTYVTVVYLMIPALILTGIFIFATESASALKLHLGLSVIVVIFLIVHVYCGLCGAYTSQYIKGMFDGYHRQSLSQKPSAPEG